MKKIYKVTIIDEDGEKSTIEFGLFEYRNLMEMVVNEIWEEWGDCKGRAMCGTCHVEVMEGDPGELDPFEQHTIEILPNKTARSRLACQIMVDGKINNMTFKILKDF